MTQPTNTYVRLRLGAFFLKFLFTIGLGAYAIRSTKRG